MTMLFFTGLHHRKKKKKKKKDDKMVESSPVLFSAFLASFFVSSAQDSGKASRKKHNKCLPVIFLMMVRPVDDTVKKKSVSHWENKKAGLSGAMEKYLSLYKDPWLTYFFSCKSSLQLPRVICWGNSASNTREATDDKNRNAPPPHYGLDTLQGRMLGEE